MSYTHTRFMVVVAERKLEGRIAVHGPFRSFTTAERRSEQVRNRVNALDLDAMVYVERLVSGSESLGDVLEAWHGI